MSNLTELLRPTWGATHWILEGWNQISAEEKQSIEKRMDAVFKHGLPFKLKHDKLLYIYAFSLLAQLEVLAIQIPLKFASKMASKEHSALMHQQLLDEIFHGLVFTKIVYLLSSPLAEPPAYSENIEKLCNFVRQEECPKIAIVMLNLIGEGLIEEIFTSLKEQNIASEMFELIIADESRHVTEADLYRAIGLPDAHVLNEKLAILEKELFTNLFLQYKYMASMVGLLGIDGTKNFLKTLNKKYTEQLAKIGLVPSEDWQLFMALADDLSNEALLENRIPEEIKISPMRQVFLTQWENPKDPTMVGEFNINVSYLDFFNKKFPKETVTLLMLQAISSVIAAHEHFRYFFHYQKMYQAKEAYTGLIVKLPDCKDHIGTIIFSDCHQLSMQDLALKSRTILRKMAYCYKKREELEEKYPYLANLMPSTLEELASDLYPYPIPGNSVISLSNIGFCGYTQAKSPLRPNEIIKFTLLEIEKKLVWNQAKNDFEPQDILPVSISADHRIYDGNLPVPKIMVEHFDKAFATMIKRMDEPVHKASELEEKKFLKICDYLIENHVELGYKILNLLQTYWIDFLAIEDLPSLKKIMAKI